jgi:hypothetical protein
MINLKHTGRTLAQVILLISLLVTVLAACGGGGDKKDQEEQPGPEASTLAAEWTPVPGEGPGPVDPTVAARIDPTNTPYEPPPEPVFQDAVELARADLSLRLSIAPDRIKVLESDSSLFLDEPLECPALADEYQDVYYVYLQFERFIYPYQAYQLAETGTVVEACADVLVDQAVLYVPTPDVRATLLDVIRADLAARGVDATNGQFQTVRAVTWTDTALGCRVGPDEEITPAIIEGYLIVYVVSGVSYEYHTDATGARVDYCAPPAGYESAEAFIEALQANEDLEMTVVAGEAAVYNGLSVEGTLVEMTDDASRVGVFGFDTNTAARGAAQRIDDASVSHIFVSGNVLVVQEENNPVAYGILLNYAEEVRTPLLEEEAQPDEELEASGPGEESGGTPPPTPGG